MIDFFSLEARILSYPDLVHGPGADIDEIASAERKLGLSFPDGYRRFISRFGWLELRSIEIYGMGADTPRYINVVEITNSERAEMHPRLRRDLLPVMNDGGGNLYCIDTSRANGPIVFWDHDLDADQEPERVSPSFEDWLFEKLGNV